MFLLIICGIFLASTTGVVCYDSDYEAIPGGWIKPHKVMRSWIDAVEQCHKESAILASPINEDILNKMISIINANGHTTPYFIGTSASLKYGIYVSQEGVPLSNMPVIDMIDALDPRSGVCLTMNHKTVSVASCSSRWPYMCFKASDANTNITECGTFDNEYKLLPAMGSCYKFHSTLVNWEDAYATCINEGGYLAIMNDSHEALSVRDFVWENNNSNADFINIGLLEWGVGGPWFSVHWEPFEKIYHRGFTQSELSSHVGKCKYHRGLLTSTGKLTYVRNSSSSTAKYQFICEKDPAYIRFPLDKKGQLNKY